ncbi:MAG: 6-bladed beta-propeller [Longimicrobiaceae bacterium]
MAVLLSGLVICGGCRDASGRGPGAGDDDVEEREWTRALYTVAEVAASPDEAAAFSAITSLDVDSKGRIYVGDWNNGQVTVLSDSAAVLRTIGKKGEGPGEFRAVDGVQVLPGDSLQVYDMQLARLTTFAPNGEVANVSTVMSSGSLAPPAFVRHSHRGGHIIAGYRRPFSTGDDPKQDAARREVVRLLDSDGRLARDSVLVLPVQQMVISRAGPMMTVRQNPFAPRSVLRLAPDDRIFYAWTDRVGIEIYSLGGKRIGGFSATHRAPSVTVEDIAEAVGPGDGRVRRLLSEAAPERWPPMRDFIVDDRARVWIALASPSRSPVEWAVFQDSGRYIGSVMLPPDVQIHRVRGDLAYGVATDELDVPKVVVYRVDPRLS